MHWWKFLLTYLCCYWRNEEVLLSCWTGTSSWKYNKLCWWDNLLLSSIISVADILQWHHYQLIYVFSTDIDECVRFSPCDQVCINNMGSYACSCEGGYELEDMRTCQGTYMWIIFSIMHCHCCLLIWRCWWMQGSSFEQHTTLLW